MSIDKWSSRKQSQNTDNIVTISYFVKTSETTYSATPYTLYRAIYSALSRTPDGGGKPLLKQTQVFRLYRSDIDNANNGTTTPMPLPKMKDKIVTESGTVFIISSKVQNINRDQEFVCYVTESANV
jgi:hypothetical protein